MSHKYRDVKKAARNGDAGNEYSFVTQYLREMKQLAAQAQPNGNGFRPRATQMQALAATGVDYASVSILIPRKDFTAKRLSRWYGSFVKGRNAQDDYTNIASDGAFNLESGDAALTFYTSDGHVMVAVAFPNSNIKGHAFVAARHDIFAS